MAVGYWKNLSRETHQVEGLELRRYLRLVIIAGGLGTAFFSLISGTALTELARSMGADSGFYGWLNAAPYVAMAAQLPISWLVEITRRRKWLFISCVSTHRALWIALAVIPFVLPDTPAWQNIRLSTLLAVYLLSLVLGAAGVPTWWGWMADMIPARVRGRYWAARSRMLILVQIPSILISGWLIDFAARTSLGLQGGIAIVFVLAAICGVLDILLFMFIPEIPKRPSDVELTLGHLLLTPLKDKAYRRYIYYSVVLAFATGGLMGQYSQRMVREVVGMNNLWSNITTMIIPAFSAWLAVTWWGRVRDRWGNRPVLVIATILVVPQAAAWVFATPQSYWVGMLITFVGGMTWAGIENANANMILQFNEGSKVSSYEAVRGIMTAIGGVAGSLVAGDIAERLAHWQYSAGPLLVTNYHVLFILSSVMRVGMVVLAVRMIEPGSKPVGEAARLMVDDILRAARSLLPGRAKALPAEPLAEIEALDEEEQPVEQA